MSNKLKVQRLDDGLIVGYSPRSLQRPFTYRKAPMRNENDRRRQGNVSCSRGQRLHKNERDNSLS